MKTCKTCGQSVTESRHTLNKASIKILNILSLKPTLLDDARIREEGLTISNYTNGTKLQHWGIIEPYITPDTVHQRGYWKLTGPGVLFMQNKLTAPKVAVTLNNKLVRYEGEEVYYDQVKGPAKQHGDYAREKAEQL